MGFARSLIHKLEEGIGITQVPALAFRRMTFIEVTGYPLRIQRKKSRRQRKKAEEDGHTVVHLIVIRHGESECNAAEKANPGVRPWIFDPHLTELGVQQAQARGKELEPLMDEIEMVVLSPLTRTCQTTHHVFGELHGKVPFLVHPLCREMLTESDDVGQFAETMQERFPQYDWTHVPPSSFWWYIPDDKQLHGETVEDFRARFKELGGWEEPEAHVRERVTEFEAFLLSTHKSRIAVVSHGDFLMGVTGVNLKNAERCMLVVQPLKPTST